MSSDNTSLLFKYLERSDLSYFVYNTFLAEIHYFDYFTINNLSDRISFEQHINGGLGLDEAIECGWLTNWVVRYFPPTHYPKTPTYIKLYFQKGTYLKTVLPPEAVKEFKRIRAERIERLKSERPTRAKRKKTEG